MARPHHRERQTVLHAEEGVWRDDALTLGRRADGLGARARIGGRKVVEIDDDAGHVVRRRFKHFGAA